MLAPSESQWYTTTRQVWHQGRLLVDNTLGTTGLASSKVLGGKNLFLEVQGNTGQRKTIEIVEETNIRSTYTH